MTSMSLSPSGGKGDKRRKGANDDAYRANWDRIFLGSKAEKSSLNHPKTTETLNKNIKKDNKNEQ